MNSLAECAHEPIAFRSAFSINMFVRFIKEQIRINRIDNGEQSWIPVTPQIGIIIKFGPAVYGKNIKKCELRYYYISFFNLF